MMTRILNKINYGFLFLLPLLTGCNGGSSSGVSGANSLAGDITTAGAGVVASAGVGGGAAVAGGGGGAAVFATIHNPEPTTMLLVGGGMMAMAMYKKNFKK
jgi:hypothetical protein